MSADQTRRLTATRSATATGASRPATVAELGKRVLIPTFDLDNEAPIERQWKPKFLHNYPTPGNDGQVRAVDAALRTTAAPTYFPSYQGCIDGGVVANNPATCALAKAVKAGTRLDELCLLSLGTGFNPRLIAGARHDWGKAQWIKDRRILDVVMDGMPGVADYQCTQLLGERRYHRLDIRLPRVIALDNVGEIDALLRIAGDPRTQQAIDATVAWLAQVPNQGS